MSFNNWKKTVLLSLTLILLAGCQLEPDMPLEEKAEAFNPELLLEQGRLNEMKMPPTPILREEEKLEGRAYSTNINFGDPLSLSQIPNVNSTFVFYPGYVALLDGGAFMQVWLSNGPGTNMIGHNPPGKHYHISWDGFCIDFEGNETIYGLETENGCIPVDKVVDINRYHHSMFGNEWLAALSRKVGEGRKNFDLTRIRVRGSVPITLFFKDNNDNWWFWNSINPGYWHLPGADNIKEFHLRAASGDPGDNYSVDDIRITPR